MNNKLFKCLHCKRNLGHAGPHRCQGNIRKRHLIFKHRVHGNVIGSKEMVKSYLEKIKAGTWHTTKPKTP